MRIQYDEILKNLNGWKLKPYLKMKGLINTLLLLTFCRDLFSERVFDNDSRLGSMTLGLRHRINRLILFFLYIVTRSSIDCIKDITEFVEGVERGFPGRMRTLYPFYETEKLPTGEIVCYLQMRWFDLNAGRAKKNTISPLGSFRIIVIDAYKIVLNRTNPVN